MSEHALSIIGWITIPSSSVFVFAALMRKWRRYRHRPQPVVVNTTYQAPMVRILSVAEAEEYVKQKNSSCSPYDFEEDQANA